MGNVDRVGWADVRAIGVAKVIDRDFALIALVRESAPVVIHQSVRSTKFTGRQRLCWRAACIEGQSGISGY